MMAGNSYPVTSWSYTYGTVIPGDSIYGFTNTAGNSLLAPDTGLCRLSSGKLEVTTSASCNALGGISAATAAFSSSLSVGGGAIGSNTFYCYNSTATTGSTLCTVQDGAGQSGAALQVKQNGGTVGLSLASSGTITSANGVIVTGGKTCTLNTTTGVFACV
jgi:hypothetical protein